MSSHTSWVHGNSVVLEHVGSGQATGKRSVYREIVRDYGDLVDLGRNGAASCLKTGGGSRFDIHDTKSKKKKKNGEEKKDKPKSGSFWCHFAIPTPVFEGKPVHTNTVLLNYQSSDTASIVIEEVHVYDGNKRIFSHESPLLECDKFNGGISDTSVDSPRPDPSRIWKGDIRPEPVCFAVGVSLLIKANEVEDDFLEIRSVGVDFQTRESN